MAVVVAAWSVFAPSSAIAQGAPPRLMLWAWERGEDLRALDSRAPEVGVAFLAETVNLTAHGVVLHPRRQPLRVSDATYLLAVVRVETEPRAPRDAAQREAIVAAVRRAARLPRVRGVQIDYDARRSERAFHGEVLTVVRAMLPRGMFFSVTALASWCVGDRWLAGRELPVDEIVPMVFAMGPAGASLRRAVAERGDFVEPRCRTSVGFAVGEPTVTVPRERRVYWFSPNGWQPDVLDAITNARTP